MGMARLLRTAIPVIVLAASGNAMNAAAQSYPAKPVRMVVPYLTGSLFTVHAFEEQLCVW